MKVRTATGLLAWIMRRVGFLGWTSFWGVVYVLPGHERNARLLRHERKHLEQIDASTDVQALTEIIRAI